MTAGQAFRHIGNTGKPTAQRSCGTLTDGLSGRAERGVSSGSAWIVNRQHYRRVI